MQQGGQFEFRRQSELRLEERLLGSLIEFRQKKVQPDFTHGAELWLTGKTLEPVAQLAQMLGLMLLQIDRVHAERGI